MRRICIIGGNGKMGGMMARLLEGNEVAIIDPNAGNGLILEDSSNYEVVIVSVPISATRDTLLKLDGICRDQLIFDISSLKSPFLDILKDMGARRRVCSVHPMFGPGIKSVQGRNMILCDCGSMDAVNDVASLFEGCGMSMRRMDVAMHDEYMSYVLGLSHAVNIAFFRVLEQSGIPFQDFQSVSSTTFEKMMDTNISVALEDPRLYYEIQHLNVGCERMWIEFAKAVDDVKNASLNPNPEDFIKIMNDGRMFFTKG